MLQRRRLPWLRHSRLRRERNVSWNGNLPINGNVTKRNASFYEVYSRVNITLDDMFLVGVNEYYSPDFLNLGGWGNYASVTGKCTAPGTWFGTTGIGMYFSGEVGRQWLGTSDAFYGSPCDFPLGIPAPSYNTWNVGVGFTYKVFTLDLRYSDTNLSKGRLQRLHLGQPDDLHEPGQHNRHKSRWVPVQLVQRDRYRQAVGRPDGCDQPEVSHPLGINKGGRAICRPLFCTGSGNFYAIAGVP